MPLHARPRRRSALRLVVILALTSLTLTACPNVELANRMVEMVNAERTSRGLPALTIDAEATAKAEAWADHLASIQTLEHSNLPDGFTTWWNYLGENVAFASTLEGTHTALMNSAGHRANILATRFTSIGIGVVEQDGVVWVTQVFRG